MCRTKESPKRGTHTYSFTETVIILNVWITLYMRTSRTRCSRLGFCRPREFEHVFFLFFFLSHIIHRPTPNPPPSTPEDTLRQRHILARLGTVGGRGCACGARYSYYTRVECAAANEESRTRAFFTRTFTGDLRALIRVLRMLFLFCFVFFLFFPFFPFPGIRAPKGRERTYKIRYKSIIGDDSALGLGFFFCSFSRRIDDWFLIEPREKNTIVFHPPITLHIFHSPYCTTCIPILRFFFFISIPSEPKKIQQWFYTGEFCREFGRVFRSAVVLHLKSIDKIKRENF